MLGGIAPILIFTFPVAPDAPNLTGIPVLDSVLSSVGVPIPVYLDEKLTGVYVTSQEKSIDIDTQPEISSDGTAKVTQRGINNTVTVHMLASKNATLLSILLAFADEAFKRAVNGKYSVTYLNGSTLVFGGKVASFSAAENDNDDLLRLTLVLHKETQATVTRSTTAIIAPVPGTIEGPS